MFSLNSFSMMPPTKVFSAYTTFMAIVMVIRTMVQEIQSMTRQLIPHYLQQKILFILARYFTINVSSQMTLVIDEDDNGGSINDMYHASELYLRNRIPPSIDRLKVSKSPKDKSFSFTVGTGEKIVDEFQGIQLTWELVVSKTRKSPPSNSESEQKSFQLCFHKEHREKVLDSYLRHVLERAEDIKRGTKVMRLYSLGNSLGKGGVNQSINLDHPSTFETLAMDPSEKQRLKDDLNRFVERRDFYRKVGKAWKRGYLLYGPPGTGKSSLVAAMANHLKFDIYDLELTSVKSNLDLRKLLLSTKNRSILVIEDIDCSAEFQDRKHEGPKNSDDSQLTLSGLLNFNDGLWSSCGDERIIVFTTNHKDKLDPALLRPGRMDMQIHMSYCTFEGFKILASNYLSISSHPLFFAEIEQLIMEVNVTPAEIAEELIRCDNDTDTALGQIIQMLQKKKLQPQQSETIAEAGKGVSEEEKGNQEIEEEGNKHEQNL